jgi:uncharacterized protein
MGKHNKNIHMVTFILLVIGGLNWLLIGLFSLDVVAYLGSTLARIVYILVGLSAIYEFAMHKGTCKTCDKGENATNNNTPQDHNNQGQM